MKPTSLQTNRVRVRSTRPTTMVSYLDRMTFQSYSSCMRVRFSQPDCRVRADGHCLADLHCQSPWLVLSSNSMPVLQNGEAWELTTGYPPGYPRLERILSGYAVQPTESLRMKEIAATLGDHVWIDPTQPVCRQCQGSPSIREITRLWTGPSIWTRKPTCDR